MAHSRYYTPRLERDLITSLYLAAKARRILMTRLASSLVREGLLRLDMSDREESCVLRDEPTVDDPRGRKY